METDWNKQVNWGGVQIGLDKYLVIMQNYPDFFTREMDWENPEYALWRKRYNHFYRVRRNEHFQRKYYGTLKDISGQIVTFEKILKNIFLKTNRVEASFSSKLLATHDPNKPVWDSEVLKKLGISVPKQYKKASERIDGIIECYDTITNWYDQELTSERGIAMLDTFNKRIGYPPITDIKKIDLMLWQKDRV